LSRGDDELLLGHIMEKVWELLDHVAAMSFWILHYAEKHNMTLDKGFEHHLLRIRSLLKEIGDPPNPELLKRLKKSRDNNLTEPPDERF